MTDSIYTAYGLTISSEIALPELLLAPNQSGAADVHVRVGSIVIPEEPGAKAIGPFAWLNDENFWLTVPDIARFQVVRDNEIILEPLEGSEPDAVRLFLLGSVFAALLFRRGLLLLHGNAIRIGDSCLVCLGPSGAGKSTLAAAFVQRGYKMLADDVIAVDLNGNALPGFPRMKLWQDSAETLNIDTTYLNPIRQSLAKFNMPALDMFCETPLPIRWLYLLTSDHRTDIGVLPVKGMDRFQTLLANTYRRRFMTGLNLGSSHLNSCGLLAQQTRMARVVRPKIGFEVHALVDCILEDVNQVA